MTFVSTYDSPEYRTISLSKGYVAIVDASDYEQLSTWKWSAQVGRSTVYAVRAIRKGEAISMHRQIMDTPPGMHTDHINGNGIDNRRSNLRVCTCKENMRNRRTPGGTSQFKGVSWHKLAEKWIAQITLNGKTTVLGLFTAEIEAARAYDAAAIERFGEFARLNFPEASVDRCLIAPEAVCLHPIFLNKKVDMAYPMRQKLRIDKRTGAISVLSREWRDCKLKHFGIDANEATTLPSHPASKLKKLPTPLE